VASQNLRFPFVIQYLSIFHGVSLRMSVVTSPGTYLILSRGCSAGSESGIQPRVNYVSKISSAFGTRYIFSYFPGTSYLFMPVATYHSTVRWQSEHQLGHHYRNATIPCVKEARWGRHEAQDSIVLSMSNDLLCSGAQHDTHTPLIYHFKLCIVPSFSISSSLLYIHRP